MILNNFAGTGKLMRFVLRKERVGIIIWVAAIVLISVAAAAPFEEIFANPEELAALAAMLGNPAMVAMMGPLFGELTPGSLYATSMILTIAIAIAFMNIFFVIRNTRGDEEKGSGEVVRSLPVGKLATLFATVKLMTLVNLVIGVLICLGLFALGFGFVGSLIYGLSIALVGVFFAGLAAVLAQVCSSARSAFGLSIMAILFFYLLRAIGDVSVQWLSFLSPLGLAAQSQPFAGNLFLPLLILLVASQLLVVAALYLNTIRDYGRGFFAEKRGRPHGSFLMQTHQGFLFKLFRKGMIIWFITIAVLAASYGAVLGDLEYFLETLGLLEFISAIELIQMIIMITVVAATVPPLAAILRMSTEERNGRYEKMYAGAISRHKVMSSHLTLAMIQSIIMMFAGMLGLWVAAAITMDDPISFGEMLGSFAIYLPALWVMIGLTALAIGLIPKHAAAVIYGYLALSFFLIYMGPTLQLPDWVQYFSPFGFIVSMEDTNFLTLSLLTVTALILIAGSFFAYRRRDLRVS